ncbi:hypothetical protein [Nocardioides sp. 616]|uniref:hypothetical protein n=1 Tax=Nocardioides sp. 616 TaxID=2268090 RepID=UPI000CE32283|nr:hypothetical protein [Nocardioides sp. 616]
MTEHENTEAFDAYGPRSTEPYAADESAQRPDGRHPLDVTHLVMGIAFLSFVGVWALISSDLVRIDDLRWLLPVPWVLAGLGGLLATAFGTRRSSSG